MLTNIVNSFLPSLYWMVTVKLSIPFGKNLPFDPKNLANYFTAKEVFNYAYDVVVSDTRRVWQCWRTC